jgi:hypothetical protein
MGVSVPVLSSQALPKPRIGTQRGYCGVTAGVAAGDCHGPALDQPIMLPQPPLLAQHLTARLFRRGRARPTRPVLVSW